MKHPQFILARVMDHSDLSPEERDQAQQEMYFAILDLLTENLPEAAPENFAGPEIAPDPARVVGEG